MKRACGGRWWGSLRSTTRSEYPKRRSTSDPLCAQWEAAFGAWARLPEPKSERVPFNLHLHSRPVGYRMVKEIRTRRHEYALAKEAA